MIIILVAAILHAVPTLVQLFMARKADFTPYIWGGLAGIVLLGVLGCLLGFSQAMMAIASAPPDVQAAMMARGIAILLNVSILTTVLVLPGLLFAGIASCLTRNLTPVRLKD
jgi:drug/metabolite transporter (DMT)-like permease